MNIPDTVDVDAFVLRQLFGLYKDDEDLYVMCAPVKEEGEGYIYLWFDGNHLHSYYRPDMMGLEEVAWPV